MIINICIMTYGHLREKYNFYNTFYFVKNDNHYVLKIALLKKWIIYRYNYFLI